MSPLGFVMAILLVSVTVALVAVPYWRAGLAPQTGRSGSARFQDDVERVLRETYCLDCGRKLERVRQSPCPHCGSSGGAAS